MLFAAPALAGNPFTAISETFSDWKDRLFGNPSDIAAAPSEGPILLEPGKPLRVRVGRKAGTREFPNGESRYRIVELPADLPHAALRVQIVAQPREHAFGHDVFKPFLYALDASDAVVGTTEIKPLHLDIRPFRRTRLLGCVALALDASRRYALATSASVVGKSYESEVRDAVKAPTQGGFYYATDAVKVKLPWAATGELILDLEPAGAAGQGC